MSLSITFAAVWESERKDSELGVTNIAARSFNCMNRISGSGSSSFGSRPKMDCIALARDMMKDCAARRLTKERNHAWSRTEELAIVQYINYTICVYNAGQAMNDGKLLCKATGSGARTNLMPEVGRSFPS